MCKVDGSRRSEAEVAEAGVIVGTAAQEPMKAALALADWRIVDAGETAAHQAVFAKLPILVPVGAEPGAAVVGRGMDAVIGDVGNPKVVRLRCIAVID